MKDILTKWGARVAGRGFAQIPNYLLELNRFVDDEHKLNATEMLTLIHLVASWWKKNEMPFPSMRTLSERSGVSERQVQRALKSLEGKGYFKKERKRIKTVISSNVYDLTPTVKILDEIAEHYGNAHPRRIKTAKELETETAAEPE